MAKFFGAVGYAAEQVETAPGVWKESIVEREYYGEAKPVTLQVRADEKVNPDLSTSTEISVLADAYANEHFFAIRYVRWAGTLWTVSNVRVQSPRLVLRLGGVYNGAKPSGAPPSL